MCGLHGRKICAKELIGRLVKRPPGSISDSLARICVARESRVGSARSQSNRIARMAIKAGLKTLVFAQSRTMVEVLTKYLKDVFDHDPRKPARIRAYRGGYLPTERREAERAMRDGRIDGIVSTSALELGVDIGALDVVVLNGYPGSIAASWQRMGRAGRRQQTSVGVLVASSDPLDQYIVQHPEFFSDAPPEHARMRRLATGDGWEDIIRLAVPPPTGFRQNLGHLPCDR